MKTKNLQLKDFFGTSVWSYTRVSTKHLNQPVGCLAFLKTCSNQCGGSSFFSVVSSNGSKNRHRLIDIGRLSPPPEKHLVF